MFSLLFVCFLAGLCKTYAADFHRIRRKGDRCRVKEDWKKSINFGGNPDYVTLSLGLVLRLGDGCGVWTPPYSTWDG